LFPLRLVLAFNLVIHLQKNWAEKLVSVVPRLVAVAVSSFVFVGLWAWAHESSRLLCGFLGFATSALHFRVTFLVKSTFWHRQVNRICLFVFPLFFFFVFMA
jgi:hypothetical protein